MPLALACPKSSGAVATPFVSAFVATGGTPPYTLYEITVGALPTGLTLNATTGAVTGTPSVANTFSFTGRVTDTAAGTATHSCSITISATTNYPLRRARRFVLPFQTNLRVFLTRLQLFMQVGMSSSAPVYLRLSKTGGKSWGEWEARTAGTLADYKARVFWNVNSSGRNWVAEIAVDDPSPWYLIDAFADLTVGLN